MVASTAFAVSISLRIFTALGYFILHPGVAIGLNIVMDNADLWVWHFKSIGIMEFFMNSSN